MNERSVIVIDRTINNIIQKWHNGHPNNSNMLDVMDNHELSIINNCEIVSCRSRNPDRSNRVRN